MIDRLTLPISRCPLTAAGLLALLAFGIFPGGITAQTFQGTFSGEGMVLTLQPSRDRYFGTLVYQGQFYAVEADAKDGRLSGTFSAEGGDFDFEASFVGEALRFETNTVTYSLWPSGKTPKPAAEEAVVDDARSEDREPPTADGAELRGAPPIVEGVAEGAAIRVPPPETEVLAEPSPPTPEPEIVDPPPAPETSEEDAARDERLFGNWRRLRIAADGDRFAGEAMDALLAADGAYTLSGETLALTGRWRTDGNTLWLRAAGSDAWRACCRYRLVADTLLLSFDDDSRQLWHRD